jgi:hypothetical protein
MKVKIFSGQEGEPISKLEATLNKWLATGEPVTIRHSDIALCSIGSSNEIYQQFILVIWYN